MLRLVESVIIVTYLGLSKINKHAFSRLDLVQITGVMNGPLKFLTARKILPLLDLRGKFKRVLACSCSQMFLVAGCYNIVIFTLCVEFHLHVLLDSLYIQFRLYLRGHLIEIKMFVQ